MKLHWGYKIGILYCSFVAFMLVLVVRSSSEDFSLVSKDYYEKEIKYQDMINKQINNGALKERLQIEWMENEGKVRISFPREFSEVNGEILLYRPSDSKKDLKLPINLGSGYFQDIALNVSDRGLWRVQVDWVSEGRAYFDEKPLIIQ